MKIDEMQIVGVKTRRDATDFDTLESANDAAGTVRKLAKIECFPVQSIRKGGYALRIKQPETPIFIQMRVPIYIGPTVH